MPTVFIDRVTYDNLYSSDHYGQSVVLNSLKSSSNAIETKRNEISKRFLSLIRFVIKNKEC